MSSFPWNRRHIVSLADFTLSEYESVLQTALSFQGVLSRRTKKVPTLQGQVVANLFFEPSTRTRSSFELAAKRLSADTLNFSPSSSSLSKGETILDTAKTYLAMGTDLMVIRHKGSGVPATIAQEMDRLGSGVGVLNAGDGQHEHPSQALLDLLTICNALNPEQPTIQDLRGKKIAIVGDILHSRVARSKPVEPDGLWGTGSFSCPPDFAAQGLYRSFLDADADRERAAESQCVCTLAASACTERCRFCDGATAATGTDERTFAAEPAGVSSALWDYARSPQTLLA